MGEKGKTRGAQILLAIIVLIMLTVFFWEDIFHKVPSMENIFLIALSIGTILLSLYYLLQVIKKPSDIFLESQKVSCVIRCVSCDYVSTREFEKGDFVLKEVGTCPRCGGNLIIYSIFRDVKEKERRSE
ncbi:MAG: hypothetical protein QXS79_02750 [Candidatus Bathyarchaeia archaeon]